VINKNFKNLKKEIIAEIKEGYLFCDESGDVIVLIFRTDLMIGLMASEYDIDIRYFNKKTNLMSILKDLVTNCSGVIVGKL